MTVPERFARFCEGVAGRMPRPLAGVVTARVVGYVLINGVSFGLDLLVLTVLHGVAGWPVGVAITIGYVVAFAAGFWLNRSLNFRSHAPVGGQVLRYVLVVAVNFAVVLLGVGAGLAAAGVPYQLARVVAGVGESVFVYCGLRWFVFRPARRPGSSRRPDGVIPS